MYKVSHDLSIGDTLEMIWCGNNTIKKFETYNGPFDFVERIAVFMDNTKMSIEKGHYYKVVE